jgi:hypothetical protein
MNRILAALKREISGITVTLPQAVQVHTLAELKPYEDMLDALVCCWIGTNYLAGEAEPFGDADAAIWMPKRRAAGASG